MYVWLSHSAAEQKLTYQCKATVLQIKKLINKNRIVYITHIGGISQAVQ